LASVGEPISGFFKFQKIPACGGQAFRQKL